MSENLPKVRKITIEKYSLNAMFVNLFTAQDYSPAEKTCSKSENND